MDREYKGVVWTNHALKRLKERGIKQGDAWATFNRPDSSRYARARGAWIYYKTWKAQKIEVVAKKNPKGEWLVLSVWSRPDNASQKRHKVKPFLIRLLEKLFWQ